MTDPLLAEILGLAIAIDEQATALYERFADCFAGEPVASFFRRMAAEEREHVCYWGHLRDLLDGVPSPAVFDQPLVARDELRRLLERAQAASANMGDDVSLQWAFNAALRLEFYLLNPSFEALFRFGVSLDPDGATLHESYGEHVNGFVRALVEYGSGSPELELAGEILGRLWVDNQRLAQESRTDVLTGLRNRRGLMSDATLLVAVAGRTGQRVGALMLDLDHFKAVNDTYGHTRGDAVLRDVAAALRASVRSADVLGRYGGEEFAVIALAPPDAPAAVFCGVGEKLRQAVARAVPGGVRLSASVGVADAQLVGAPEDFLAGLLTRADRSLYLAKEAGRDQVRAATELPE